ncbi:MAG: acyl-CoA dehydrogenase [Gammaproteobacteria bacterium]|nr:MAG: acyl-CoA dehydrogenase [Gammaproteobacteria bacterium]
MVLSNFSSWFDLPLTDQYYNEDHEAWRYALRQFIDREIAPNVDAWEEAGEFPRELYKKAAEIGLLQLGYPEQYGGVPKPDIFFDVVTCQELARIGGGGVHPSLNSHTIGMPPILALGSDEMKSRLVPEVISGEKISALAITEPSGGSDVANLKTTAQREGDHYIVNGSKTYITSGIRADYYTVAVRTGGEGASGISLLLIEKGTPGFTQTPLDKMGWWCSDTATLYFDNCRVPVENLIGTENKGFSGVMINFNSERLNIAAMANGLAMVCMDEAVAWAKERKTFGRRLMEHQVIRHKIAEMAKRILSTQALLEKTAWQMQRGEVPVVELSLLKVQATETMEYCAREAVQIFGGMGFMRGNKVERIYREVRVYAIGGGSEEIMRDLAARQLAL